MSQRKSVTQLNNIYKKNERCHSESLQLKSD